jgi:hypothetical protein
LKITVKEIAKQINWDDIKRYLSAKGEISDAWQSCIEEVVDETLSLVSPVYTGVHDTLILNDKSLVLKTCGVEIASRDLASHLSQSSEIWLVVATLGHEIERKIKYYFASNPTRGIIMDACGSAIIEAYCDTIEEHLMESHSLLDGKKIESFTSRFSPGYGDLDLFYQRKLFEVFEITKKTGIHLSTGNLMLPQKSVLFIVGDRKGESAKDKIGCQHKCVTCQLKTCIYRTEV